MPHSQPNSEAGRGWEEGLLLLLKVLRVLIGERPTVLTNSEAGSGRQKGGCTTYKEGEGDIYRLNLRVYQEGVYTEVYHSGRLGG